jgi:hypothetical protein
MDPNQSVIFSMLDGSDLEFPVLSLPFICDYHENSLYEFNNMQVQCIDNKITVISELVHT